MKKGRRRGHRQAARVTERQSLTTERQDSLTLIADEIARLERELDAGIQSAIDEIGTRVAERLLQLRRTFDDDSPLNDGTDEN